MQIWRRLGGVCYASGYCSGAFWHQGYRIKHSRSQIKFACFKKAYSELYLCIYVCINQINSLTFSLTPSSLCLSQSPCFCLSLVITWHAASYPSPSRCSDTLYSYNSSNLSVLVFLCEGNDVSGARSCHFASWFVCQRGGGRTVFDQHAPHGVSGWHYLAQRQTALCSEYKD